MEKESTQGRKIRKYIKMREALEQIKELDKLDPCSNSEAICKIVEELGEFTTEVNKTTGRKHTTDSDEVIQANLLEECADTFQNLLLIMNRFGITLEQLEPEILRKDRKWFKKMYLRGDATKEDFQRIFSEDLTDREINQWIADDEDKKLKNP